MKIRAAVFDLEKMILLTVLLFCFGCSTVKPDGETGLVLTVMSFNMLHDTADSPLSWRGRRDAVAQLIKNEGIDIAGTQELQINQLEELIKRINGYAYAGAGRDNGARGGQFDSAIIYRSEKFVLVETGNFWLSETPDWPGRRGWDAASVRMATWAILEERSSGKQVFFINTHLDHVGQTARVEGAKMILERTAALRRGLPVIFTGDLNATPDNGAIKQILDPASPVPLAHARDIAETVEGPGGTSSSGRLIDYIFVSPGITVSHYGVLPESLEGVALSDHHAVLAKIRLE